MGVTRTGSHEEGTSEARKGVRGDASAEAAPPSASDAEEHPADTLTVMEPPTAQVEPPVSPLLAGSMGDQCTNCGAPMASDQRYCVNCGERRGAGRFSTMAAPTATAAKTVGPPPERRSRPSAATWIAGVATLLIAMGVGVLIGKAGNSAPAKAQSPEVITVNGGGSTAGGTSSGSTRSSNHGSTQGSSSGTTHHSTGTTTHTSAKQAATKAKAAAKASKPTASAAKKASQAASGVTGGSGGQSNATVTTGGSCKPGSAGCTGGHFSGNFFGGG